MTAADGEFHAFPWREEETTHGHRVLRPTVEIRLNHGVDSVLTKALVDTGSPRCIFPRGVGDLIGLHFPTYPSQAPGKIHLMGRPWPIVTETVQLELDPFDPWDAEADFVVEEGLAFGLLGYEGFLNRWAVTFNGALGYLLVEPPEVSDGRMPGAAATDLRNRWPELFP